MDRTAFYTLTYGLHIISAQFEGKDFGCVVNTLAQVTSAPPKMAVAIHKNNFTKQMVEKAGYFAAVALTQDADMKLIGSFGFKSSRDTDKFAAYPFARDENGVAYITQFVAARFSLRLSGKLDLGTHVMLIGDVLDAQVLSDGEPLTYAYYQTVKKGVTPKNAPSYQKPAAGK